MVDPFKLFWVLTNSTYIVTKFIKVGNADKNDTTIFFDKNLYETEVDENENFGHVVLNISAHSSDNDSSIKYQITEGNADGVFDVNSTTGTIFVRGKLDYENKNTYKLLLEASSNGAINYTSVLIHVMDLNDNPPVFGKQSYRVQIIEEDDKDLPKRILKVQATDADKYENIVYFLAGQGIDSDNPSNSKFEIDRISGEIFVLKPLDRDPPHGRALWRFTVFAQDEGGEGLVGYADVQVLLKDINDMPPKFTQHIYEGNITENDIAGRIVVNVTAKDQDDPTEGKHINITYSIEKNVVEENTGLSIFDIDANNGTIWTLVCCLDREKSSQYTLQVVATDGGGLTDTGIVIIYVLDVNDMQPSFTKSEYFAEVNETDNLENKTTQILTVFAHDDDEVSHFHYSVVPNSGYGVNKFKMVTNSDGSGSLVTIQPLDYEDILQRNGFRFQIKVTDMTNTTDGVHSAYSWVVIKLKDVNDNYPKFQQSRVDILLSEDTTVGTSLAFFKAEDLDQKGKSKITYMLNKKPAKRKIFDIDKVGVITLQNRLDREIEPSYQLYILAVDDGVPPKTATATLNVLIQDINDNAPTFLEEYRPVLMENSEAREIIKIEASDKDDVENSGPFQFWIDTNSSDSIRSSFSLEQSLNGNGSAVLKSTRRFDREQQKTYEIPIIIKDSGNPPMSGTSTLTVTIGDINDNTMKAGRKDVTVYVCEGEPMGEIEIGRVFVHDLDDWDLSDKKFHWEAGEENPRFSLNEGTGMISTRRGTPLNGTYLLRFKVQDEKFMQTVPAEVAVIIKTLRLEAIRNSASVRIAGLSDEDFIRTGDFKQGDTIKRKSDLFQRQVADLLKIDLKDIEIFSVEIRNGYPPVTDVRFSAYNTTEYISPVKINGILSMHVKEIESLAGVNITLIGVDDCYTKFPSTYRYEHEYHIKYCQSALSYLVDANATALVSSKAISFYKCVSGACTNDCTYSTDNKNRQSSGCKGPNCELSFSNLRNSGWRWFPPLYTHETNHLHLEFFTTKLAGLILYNGPLTSRKYLEATSPDFLSLDISEGRPRLLINYGVETLELIIATTIIGRWHRIDVLWNKENISMILDFCKSAFIFETKDDVHIFNDSNCQIRGQFLETDGFLNVTGPLQIGGTSVLDFLELDFDWSYLPASKTFDGCIKNVMFNSFVVNLESPCLFQTAFNLNEVILYDQQTDQFGCPKPTHSITDSYSSGYQCPLGYTGPDCSTPTTPTSFNSQSYIRYALNFDPDPFQTIIQLKFRTRETDTELFRISHQTIHEYIVLELFQSKLRFRYNLNSFRTEEINLVLSDVTVTDGEWHSVKVSRHGSLSTLELDHGTGRGYNESFQFKGHQLLSSEKYEGLHIGRKLPAMQPSLFEASVDFQGGCLDDIRLNGKQLPLPPGSNGTQWGQVVIARNVTRNCISSNPCIKISCLKPMHCVDLWNKYECRCKDGYKLSSDNKSCIDNNECMNRPCLNGGTCTNFEPKFRYKCNCPDGYAGENCEIVQEEQKFKLSLGAMAAILACLLIISVFSASVMCNSRKKSTQKKMPSPKTDIRENVISYNDDGRGEDDMTAFDMMSIKIRVNVEHFEVATSTSNRSCDLTASSMRKDSRSEISDDALPMHFHSNYWKRRDVDSGLSCNSSSDTEV